MDLVRSLQLHVLQASTKNEIAPGIGRIGIENRFRRLHCEWFQRSPLADLLGEDAGPAEIHKLYRCQERIELATRGRIVNNSFLDQSLNKASRTRLVLIGWCAFDARRRSSS